MAAISYGHSALILVSYCPGYIYKGNTNQSLEADAVGFKSMAKQTTLIGQNILLGVSGGIAAYKSADLVRRLKEAGADVRVVMTESAQAFITPLTFQALSGHPVHTQLLDEDAEAGMGHIELARWADQILVAPATANTMARLTYGIADDLLTTICLASEAPVSLAPAMNRLMWVNPATQANADLLQQRGIRLLGPGEGDQACGEVGAGRMLEPSELVEALAQDGPLAGSKVVITAGPTFEDVDPVRFLGNRSSGKMGFALAEAAQAAGAEVTLIAGPVALQTPKGVRRIDVRSAADMYEAVFEEMADCRIYISAAAVADYTIAKPADNKIKKDGEVLNLALTPTNDIISAVAKLKSRPFIVGFAAETDDVLRYAHAKLIRKGLDMIAANQVGGSDTGFESDNNEITLVTAQGEETLGHGSKKTLARKLMTRLVQEYQGR